MQPARFVPPEHPSLPSILLVPPTFLALRCPTFLPALFLTLSPSSTDFLRKYALGSQKVWLPAKVAMVLFIPPVYHGMWCSLVNFGWTVLLASMATAEA